MGQDLEVDGYHCHLQQPETNKIFVFRVFVETKDVRAS